MKYEKIYKVTFMKYANAMRTIVSDRDRPDCTYLDTSEPFLVRESELELYNNFGGGFRSTEFVGMLPITDFGIASISHSDSERSSVKFGFNNIEDIPNNME